MTRILRKPVKRATKPVKKPKVLVNGIKYPIDPITMNRDVGSSIYNPTTNDEHKQLSLPPWLQKTDNQGSQDPLGIALGSHPGGQESTPAATLRLIVNSMQQAKTVGDMRKANTELRTLNRSLTQNILMTRATWMFEHMLDPRGRDLFRECGYPLAMSAQMYREMFDRDGTASRVVELIAEESWENVCEVYETEDEEKTTKFEQAWKDICDTNHMYHYMERIDKLSGIGSYGLMLLGIDDGKQLNEPIDGLDPTTGDLKKNIKEHELLYIRVFDESLCHIGRWNTDQTTKRYAQPEIYLIRFLDYSTVPIGQSATDVITHMVHWSRVVHIADNRKSSEVFGVPRMQHVFNRLLDLRKLYGGSAEMFWKGGFPGIGLEVLPELADAEIDQAAVREQMEAYQQGLKRYVAVAGMTLKTLAPNIAQPKEHVDIQLQNIALSIGVPLRVLLGSEQAVKAGEQDSDAWDVRLQRRKNQYLTPMVVRPVVERLIAMGVLPAPKNQFIVSWPESSAPTLKDKAAIATSFANAIAAYMSSSGDQLITPVDFFVTVCGLDKETANEIVENAQQYAAQQQAQQGGGLPTADDLVQALGMSNEDAGMVLDTIQQLMTQQQDDNSDSNGNQPPYQQQSGKDEDASGGISGGVSGGDGSAGVTGTPGGQPWKV